MISHHPATHSSATLIILALLAVSSAAASPDRVRARAASFVQSIATGQCDIAASLVAWPLEIEGESIELGGWRSPCERLRARLITARIDAVFQSDELTSTMPPRQLEREDVYFVDLVRIQRADRDRASGMNLAFECNETECRIVAIHERLLHHRHYNRQAAARDDERFARAARLAQVVQTLTPLRITLMEHFQYNGEWPASIEDLGLDPNRLHARGIEKVELLPGGGIRAHLSAEFGAGRTLDLIPAEEMDGLSMRWNCRTNLPGELTATMVGLDCRSRQSP